MVGHAGRFADFQRDASDVRPTEAVFLGHLKIGSGTQDRTIANVLWRTSSWAKQLRAQAGHYRVWSASTARSCTSIR